MWPIADARIELASSRCRCCCDDFIKAVAALEAAVDDADGAGWENAGRLRTFDDADDELGLECTLLLLVLVVWCCCYGWSVSNQSNPVNIVEWIC